MADLHKAEAAAREAHSEYTANPHVRGCADACAYALRDLLAALDAARGEAVAWRVWRGDSYELFFNEDAAKRRCQCFVQQRSPEPLYAAPPAALAGHWEACARELDAIGDRGTEPPAALAVPADNVTPMRQPRADLARLVESINAAVYANGDGLSVTEAIGALELAKLELLKEQEQ